MLNPVSPWTFVSQIDLTPGKKQCPYAALSLTTTTTTNETSFLFSYWMRFVKKKIGGRTEFDDNTASG